MSDRASLGRWVPAIAIVVLLAIPAPAHAAAGITGRVIDATTHRPVPDERVTMLVVDGSSTRGRVTAVTDGGGRFAFGAPPTSASGIQLVATYRGATYRTSLISISDAAAPLTLRVYRPTSDPAEVLQSSWVVWVDVMPGGLVVQHDLSWKNDGAAAYVGSGDGVVTEVPLAPGATNLQFLGLYLNGGGRVRGDVYRGGQPIVPGSSSATVRYVVPTLSRLALVSPLSTRNLHVFVAQGLSASAPGMTPGGTVTDRGTTYQVLTAENLAAGRTIGLTIGRTAPQVQHRAPFALGGIAVLALVAAGAVWRARRGRSRAAPTGARRSSIAPRGLAAEDDAETLLEEIAAIDIAFEEGLLEADTYERVRAAAKQRLAATRLRRST